MAVGHCMERFEWSVLVGGDVLSPDGLPYPHRGLGIEELKVPETITPQRPLRAEKDLNEEEPTLPPVSQTLRLEN